MSESSHRSARLISDFAAKAERHLLRVLKVEQDTAARIARAIAEDVRTDYAGQLIYIPIGGPLRGREKRIFDAWLAGRHPADLATEYGVSMNTIYKCINAERDRRQPDLFPDADDPE